MATQVGRRTPDWRLMVTGGSGLLGSAVVAAAVRRGRSVVAVSRRKREEIPGATWVLCDLARPGAVARLMNDLRPAVVVHCAALTNVDWCETHPLEADEVNALLPGQIAACAVTTGARMVYISTDSVFDGLTGGYKEEDVPAPVNVYARSKREGEKHVQAASPECLVIRTNLFGSLRAGHGFAEWILMRLRERQQVPGFTDAVFNPLLTADLADLLLDMVDRGFVGVYHMGARDSCTKFDFARRLAREFGYDETAVRPAQMTDANLAAPRPRNTVLCVGRVSAALGREMPTLGDGLRRLRQLSANPGRPVG